MPSCRPAIPPSWSDRPAARRRRHHRRRQPLALRRAASRPGRSGVRSRSSAGADARTRRRPHARAAGAIGVVIAENRAGDPTSPRSATTAGRSPTSTAPGSAQAMAGRWGGHVRFSRETSRSATSWAGVPTSFTSGGLTPFGKALKPDLTAPGAQILSSTLPEFAGDQFAVLDGTSFSAPHVAGAAALLLERHPSWTPQQVKSALMSTAGPAFADSSKTQEASVLVQGAGLVRFGRGRAGDLHRPAVALFRVHRRDRARRAKPSRSSSPMRRRRGHVECRDPASGRVAGATVEAAPFTLGPGGTAAVQVVARAAAGAVAGDNFGFVILRRGDVVRRIPYAFSVTRPRSPASRRPAQASQTGDTRSGEPRARLPLADVSVRPSSGSSASTRP